MNFSKLVLVLAIGSIFFVSCSDDDENINNDLPLGSYDNGVLILNQGGFGLGDASVSYISDDFSVAQNDIFSLVNPTITLGDTGQDIGFYDEYGYIVLNVSNKIEIVNRYTMKSVGSITEGLDNPRYITFANGKGYVTNWGDGGNTEDDYVAVIDLVTNTVSSEIPVAEGPERIIENAGKLYVAHTGGFGFGNTISVINTTNNSVLTTINVGDVPNSMQIKDGMLWVSCAGKPSYVTETPGQIDKINLTTNTVTSIYTYTDVTKHISNLAIEGNDIYFTVDAGIYKFAVNATSLPENPIFSTTDQGVYGVYSFAINNNHIYVGDAGNYSDNGKVIVYSMSGTLENTFTVGVIPAGFYFNE